MRKPILALTLLAFVSTHLVHAESYDSPTVPDPCETLSSLFKAKKIAEINATSQKELYEELEAQLEIEARKAKNAGTGLIILSLLTPILSVSSKSNLENDHVVRGLLLGLGGAVSGVYAIKNGIKLAVHSSKVSTLKESIIKARNEFARLSKISQTEADALEAGMKSLNCPSFHVLTEAELQQQQ